MPHGLCTWPCSRTGTSTNFFLPFISVRLAVAENLSVAFYRRNLPHLQRDYKPHFLTFCTKERWILPGWARGIILEACRYGHGTRYNLRVAIVMPDHAHMILTPLTDYERMRIFPLRQITHTIKSYSAHQINRKLGRTGAVWQDESFDHVMRSSESLDAMTAYILADPVRQGLVKMAAEYPWAWEKPAEWCGTGVSPV